MIEGDSCINLSALYVMSILELKFNVLEMALLFNPCLSVLI